MIRRRHWAVAALACAAASRVGATPAPVPVVFPAQTRLLSGKLLGADAFIGQGWLVVFWATHCPFCQRHNAKLHQLMQALGERAPKVLAVSSDRDAATVQRYMRTHGYLFLVTLDAAPWQQALGVRRVLPTTVPVNRRGERGLVMPGEMFEEDLAEMAAWALGGAKG